MTAQLMSQSERRALQQYLRLILSYSDFKHAYRCAQYLLAEHEQHKENGGDDLLLKALYSSLVISYCRPFNSSGVAKTGRVPSLDREFKKTLSEVELDIHSYLLHCRNKLIAHTDAQALDVSPFVATDLPNDMVVPDKIDGLAPFTKDYTEVVLPLAHKAYRWCVEERHRLEPQVIHILERRPRVSGDSASRLQD